MIDDLLLGSYEVVAEKLGLVIEGSVSEGHLRIHGAVDGVPLQMWFGSHATHVSAPLTTPAQLPLSVVTNSLMAKLGHLFGGDHVKLGDADFDKTFSVKTTDVDRLGALLDRDARGTLLELARAGLHPAIDQHTVHLRHWSSGGTDAEANIERDFRQAARLTKVVSASFARAR